MADPILYFRAMIFKKLQKNGEAALPHLPLKPCARSARTLTCTDYHLPLSLMSDPPCENHRMILENPVIRWTFAGSCCGPRLTFSLNARQSTTSTIGQPTCGAPGTSILFSSCPNLACPSLCPNDNRPRCAKRTSHKG